MSVSRSSICHSLLSCLFLCDAGRQYATAAEVRSAKTMISTDYTPARNKLNGSQNSSQVFSLQVATFFLTQYSEARKTLYRLFRNASLTDILQLKKVSSPKSKDGLFRDASVTHGIFSVVRIDIISLTPIPCRERGLSSEKKRGSSAFALIHAQVPAL